jgi:hypothetical protein
MSHCQDQCQESQQSFEARRQEKLQLESRRVAALARLRAMTVTRGSIASRAREVVVDMLNDLGLDLLEQCDLGTRIDRESRLRFMLDRLGV